MKTTQTIRNIDQELYRRFRGYCVTKNIQTGDAITEAINMWLDNQK